MHRQTGEGVLGAGVAAGQVESVGILKEACETGSDALVVLDNRNANRTLFFLWSSHGSSMSSLTGPWQPHDYAD